MTVNKSESTSLLHFCEAKHEGSVPNVSVLASMSSRLHNVLSDICLYTLHVYHIFGLWSYLKENCRLPLQRGSQRCGTNSNLFIYFSPRLISQNETSEFSLRNFMNQPRMRTSSKQSSSFGRIPLHRGEGTVFIVSSTFQNSCFKTI